MQDYKKLSVWQKSHEVVLSIYTITSAFPKEEQYMLVQQMRKAAYSIPMNIAEGCGRNSQPDLAHFLNMALGSINELNYQLLLARDLNYLKPAEYEMITESLGEVRAMMLSLITKIRNSINP